MDFAHVIKGLVRKYSTTLCVDVEHIIMDFAHLIKCLVRMYSTGEPWLAHHLGLFSHHYRAAPLSISTALC